MQRVERGRDGCRGESGSDFTSTSAITRCGSEARSHTRTMGLVPPTSVAQVVLAASSIAGRTRRAGMTMLVGGLADPVSPGEQKHHEEGHPLGPGVHQGTPNRVPDRSG